MTMTILLTGSKGFVGARIREALPVVEAPSLRDATDDDVKRLIDSVRPDVIVHTAAMSDIGDCARWPEAARRANVDLPLLLAKAAGGAKLVMFSTDQVYSGCAEPGPYAEETVAPDNLYAELKIEMERRVLDIDPNAVMLRATWMYDAPIYGILNRGNFLANTIGAALRGETMRASATEMRGITWVREVAAHIPETFTLPGGAYNYGSENTMTMLETTACLCDALGIKNRPEPAGHGHNLWMDCQKLRAAGIRFNTTAEGIAACVKAYALGPSGA